MKVSSIRPYTIAKYIFTLAFIIFNVITYLFVEELENNSDCTCINKDEVTNMYFFLNTLNYVKTFSIIAICIGAINLIIPLTRTFINMFLIGGFITLALFVLLILQAMSLNRILNIIKSDECSGICKLPSMYETFGNYLLESTLTIYAIVIAVVLIGLRL